MLVLVVVVGGVGGMHKGKSSSSWSAFRVWARAEENRMASVIQLCCIFHSSSHSFSFFTKP